MHTTETTPSMLDPHFVVVNERGGEREALLRRLADRLHSAGIVHDGFAEAIVSREALFPTGLPTHPFAVAIPHADPVHVRRAFVSVARLAEPVLFAEMGGAGTTVDVRLVVMLALTDGTSQLDMLQRLVATFADSTVMGEIRDAPDGAALHTILVDRIG